VASFIGKETFTLDNKGRVSVPAKMRKSIPAEAENTFRIMRGMDKCIFAYPINIWNEKYQPKLDNLNQFNSKNRVALRNLNEWSEDIVLDTQQRMTLPKELLELAGIDGKIIVLGVSDHIEFWCPENYERYKNDYENYINENDASYEAILEEVFSSTQSAC